MKFMKKNSMKELFSEKSFEECFFMSFTSFMGFMSGFRALDSGPELLKQQ